MLSYDDLAARLGLNRSTLTRKILAFNKAANLTGGDQIQPDLKEKHPGYTKHFFNPARAAQIKAALDGMTAPRRGRPPTTREQA